MEINQVLDSIEAISLKLMIEEDSAKIQQGLNIIHGLASHRSFGLLEPEVKEFLSSYSDDEEQPQAFTTPLVSRALVQHRRKAT